MGITLAQKIWDSHVVHRGENNSDLLYIDLHLLHEVNTPQAFDSLRNAGLSVRRPDLTVGTEDHNTSTLSINSIISNPVGWSQVEMMRKNCAEFNIPLHRIGDPHQGIVHVIGPELGMIRPGMTIACCDSHTTTHGAFGTLAFGIGTSQVEHVLATQTLLMQQFKHMSVTVRNRLSKGVTSKDLALALITKIGAAGGQGHIIEYQGEAIAQLSMEARMTLCNMTVEAGSVVGLIAPDDVTFHYLEKLPNMPQGDLWRNEVKFWKTLYTDEDAVFDKEVYIDASSISPYVSWGTNPSQSVPLAEFVPDPDTLKTVEECLAAKRALDYMQLRPGTAMRDIAIDVVFIGSCTNGRIEDLRAVAEILKGRRISKNIYLLIVPGSNQVRQQAIEEGLDKIFADAGADFRPLAGCSMCVGLNEDRLKPGQRAASTNNRNFEGRQGKGSHTHIVSPPVAAATAVMGRLAAPSDLE